VIRSEGVLAALPAPELAWDDNGEPHNLAHDDSYFSRQDGAAETRHVFLAGNALGARLADTQRASLRIGELGFGTGLNFLETWALLRDRGHAAMRLHYCSVDECPLHREQLERVHARWPRLAPLADALRGAYPPPLPGLHRRVFDGGRLVLDLYFSNAASALAELDSGGGAAIDAWYLDGFAPSRNASMWDTALLAQVARCSRGGATLATYSAAGTVRRGLESCGFSIRRRPGHGHKRECLAGSLDRPPLPAPPTSTPWERPRREESDARTALVIGAGLAGAHAAAALARRGLSITVLESGDMAQRASGNPQGLLYTRLSHRRSPLADFSLSAFLYSANLYRGMFAQGRLEHGRDGDLSGCFLTHAGRGNAAAVDRALAGLHTLGEPLPAVVAAARLGAKPCADGTWLHDSGWLAPRAVCAALLAHPRIEVREHAPVHGLHYDAGHWHACDASGSTLASAPVVVIAAGVHSVDFLELDTCLPLKPIRGQVTLLPAKGLPALKHALCHRGYIAPARDDRYCIGATFAPGDTALHLRQADHEENLQLLAEALPSWLEALQGLAPQALEGRAELRTASPDYLPVAGPIARREAFLEHYEALGRDARRTVPGDAPYLPGAFVSAAHGSRGLSYAALAGELIASQVCSEPPPMTRDLLRAVAPARFLLRELIRGERGGAQAATR
jgi:tRNA 5-methylaminomethyl-2-thiouridine biosynthesis bifunctional protein